MANKAIAPIVCRRYPGPGAERHLPPPASWEIGKQSRQQSSPIKQGLTRAGAIDERFVKKNNTLPTLAGAAGAAPECSVMETLLSWLTSSKYLNVPPTSVCRSAPRRGFGVFERSRDRSPSARRSRIRQSEGFWNFRAVRCNRSLSPSRRRIDVVEGTDGQRYVGADGVQISRVHHFISRGETLGSRRRAIPGTFGCNYLCRSTSGYRCVDAVWAAVIGSDGRGQRPGRRVRGRVA